ncbi:MAG: Gfo/Idh/MocA family oxidoreductase [Thermomicrobiales bacterium]|nr:Gfo/Idh/MocA family oxidoreductase [Thermomicrobiales bacterium]
MTKYRAGIIGLGRISSTIDDEVIGHPRVALPYAHMACLREVPEIEVVAGADGYQEQRDAFSTRWGVDNLYADYREMLAKERLDYVTIATPAKPRHDIFMDCVNAGVKAIYAEKPISLSLADADEMVAAARAKGIVVGVGCTRRWDPYWQMIRAQIENGELGDLLQVNVMGSAGISHNGSHMIDLIRFLVDDDVAWVFGESESDELAASDDDHQVNGYLAFRGGVRSFIRTWSSGASDWSVEVVGTRGTIRAFADGLETDWIERSGRSDYAKRFIPRPQRINAPGVNAIYDLMACIESGGKPACSGDDAVKALEIAIALRESHRAGGKRIDLPLADRSLLIRSAEVLRGDLPVAIQRRQAAAS